MLTFLIVGAVGLLALLVSLVLDDLLDLGDGAISGTSLGAGALVFGAIGSIVTANDAPVVWAYVASAVFGVLTLIGVQFLIKRLRASEDGKPRVIVGLQGSVTATVTTGGGEVSLDDPQELERRLAWGDDTIPVGTRIVVVEHSGSRVKVEPLTRPTTPDDA